MNRHPARPKPKFLTVAEIQAGPHYASHVDQPNGSRHPLSHVPDAEMDQLLHSCDPATARGIPSAVNYANGVVRVWPWPAEGWQVWSGLTGRPLAL